MINYVNIEALKTFKKTGSAYTTDIINQRNLLAHVTEDTIDGNRVLKSHATDKKEIIFDANLCKSIRDGIRTYKNKFEEIKKIISR